MCRIDGIKDVSVVFLAQSPDPVCIGVKYTAMLLLKVFSSKLTLILSSNTNETFGNPQ